MAGVDWNRSPGRAWSGSGGDSTRVPVAVQQLQGEQDRGTRRKWRKAKERGVGASGHHKPEVLGEEA